jgi:hypothetical protein
MAKQLTGGGEVGDGATGRAFSPPFANHSTGATHPFCEVMSPFVLAHNPIRWMVQGGRLIPALHKITLEQGVNHIQKDREGRISFARARTKLNEEGRTVIPYEWGPNGESYVQVVDTRPQGKQTVRETYLYFSETAALGDTRIIFDEDAYSEWAHGLVTSGKLAPCPPYIAQRIADKLAKSLEDNEARASKGGEGSGAAKLRARKLRADLEVVTAAIDSVKPKRVRGRTAKPSLGEGVDA